MKGRSIIPWIQLHGVEYVHGIAKVNFAIFSLPIILYYATTVTANHLVSDNDSYIHCMCV